MRRDLSIDWDAALNSNTTDVKEQWNIISKKIKEAVETHVPSYQTTEKGLWKKEKFLLQVTQEKK